MRVLVFLSICALMTSLLGVGVQASDENTNINTEQSIPKIELEYMMQIQVVGPNIGNLEQFSPAGRVMIGRIMGGQATGPVLNGEVLPVGEDWALLRADDSLEVDVHTLIRTDDGALIHVYWKGLWHGSKEVKDRILAGQDVAPSEYYLRMTPRFETLAPKYTWLNNVIAVGYGKVNRGAGVTMSVFKVI